MRSHAKWGPPLERALRGMALLSVIVLLVGAYLPRRAITRTLLDGSRVEQALEGWYRTGLPDTLVATFELPPDEIVRAGLEAIRRNGTAVQWWGGGRQLGIEVEALADPAGGSMIRVVSPVARAIALSDDIGVVGDHELDGSGAVLRATVFGSRIAVMRDGRAAMDAIRVDVPRRAVAVYGRVGWEARFMIRALEGRGWKVEARLEVAPGRFVRQGRPTPLDTSRFGTAIVLDVTAADQAGSLQRFAKSGGGVVLLAEAGGAGAYRSIAVGTEGAVRHPVLTAFEPSRPLASLAHQAITNLTEGAVVLRRIDGDVTVAARRLGAGRVIQVSYRDLWRWHMTGDGGSGYESFVSDLVSSASLRSVPDPFASEATPAPLAQLAAAIGPPTLPTVGREARSLPSGWYEMLVALVLTSLMLEWASRRLRSVP